MPWMRQPDAAKGPAAVCVLKVALAERKSVWRRIAIRADQSLDDLHLAIFKAFDRDDEHLYSFYLPKSPPKGDFYLGAQWVQDAATYTCPEDDQGHDASDTRLATLNLKPGQAFFYVFDYGDEWWHEIAVESVGGPLEKGKYPRVLEKQGESPEQYPGDEDEEDDEESDEDAEA